jgi:hypothetical protein
MLVFFRLWPQSLAFQLRLALKLQQYISIASGSGCRAFAGLAQYTNGRNHPLEKAACKQSEFQTI